MGLQKQSAKITKEITQRSGLRERGGERPPHLHMSKFLRLRCFYLNLRRRKKQAKKRPKNRRFGTPEKKIGPKPCQHVTFETIPPQISGSGNGAFGNSGQAVIFRKRQDCRCNVWQKNTGHGGGAHRGRGAILTFRKKTRNGTSI